MIVDNAHGNNLPACQSAVLFLRVAEKVRRGLLDIERCRVVAHEKPPLRKLGLAPSEKLHVHDCWAFWIGYDGQNVPRRAVWI